MGRTKSSPTKRRIMAKEEEKPEIAGRLVTPEQVYVDLLMRDYGVEFPVGSDAAAAIEQEPMEQTPKKKQRKKSSNTKSVRFADDEASPAPTATATATPPTVESPEIDISSAASKDGEVAWELHIHPAHNEQDSMMPETRDDWKLKVYRLARTNLSGESVVEGSAIARIRTASGAMTLLEHCETVCDSQEKVKMKPVGAAVADGTVAVECRWLTSRTVQVTVSLTERAFEVCSASTLPHSNRRKASKQYRPVRMVQEALACLFPDTVVSDVVNPLPSKGPVTSKMVYDLVDNVRLNEYEACGGYESKPMSIPGLNPTLRPYQEAAVKWMLRRERGEEPTDKEWELAWVVFSAPFEPPNSQSDSFVSLGASILSIPEWKRQNDAEVIESGLLYCPFFGFFALSGIEAYKETIDSFSKAGKGHEWEQPAGGILGESMGLGKSVEVLACLLENRLVLPENTHEFRDLVQESNEFVEEKKEDDVGTADLLRDDESDEEFEFDDDISRKPDDDGSPRVLLDKWVDSLGACACGISGMFKDCISLVLCQSCHMPLHGTCAGFSSVHQLDGATTREIFDEQYDVRVCSRDRCPSCVFHHVQESGTLIPSRATLIITPGSILSQWQRELQRHASPAEKLKIVVYPGIRELCNNGSKAHQQGHLMHPYILANTDIVLMTFEALMGDLGHSDENPFVQDSSGLRLRTTKKYRIIPSPLLSIRWWRVALDEAQRVEAPTATSARMAQKIVAQHRWCVSGTPVGRGRLEDLHGLFIFLRIGPFSSKDWFNSCFCPDHRGLSERICHLLATCMWRSTKASDSVRGQMKVPDQIERKIVLKFSSIERHFYDRQLEETLSAFHNVSSGERKRKSADDLLVTHLHRLRAACCHPQVGTSGIGRPRKKRRDHSIVNHDGHRDVSVSSGVLSMEQILDKLIEDARVKCEESQRLVVMHTNAMASLQHLKVEAKEFGVKFSETDENLLRQSCRTYLEALEMTDANSRPGAVVGEAILGGSKGFLFSREVMRDGKARLVWQIKYHPGLSAQSPKEEVWSRIDFEGASKKITGLKVCAITDLSALDHDTINKDVARLIQPKKLVFQVANAALGGQFMDVASVQISEFEEASDNADTAATCGGFITNKSKSWRVLLNDFMFPDNLSDDSSVFVIGVEIELLEADIAADSLQRLHILHNASLTMATLLEQPTAQETPPFMTRDEMVNKLLWMKEEAGKIESLYMDMARGVHAHSQHQLKSIAQDRAKVEQELLGFTRKSTRSGSMNLTDCFEDYWWDDLLSMYALYGSPQEQQSLCYRVQQELYDFVNNTEEGRALVSHKIQNGLTKTSRRRLVEFPEFANVNGLRAALNFRLRDYRDEVGVGFHDKIIQRILELSPDPADDEVFENSHCRKCREDWHQTGPECRHCKLERTLEETVEPDHIILAILRALFRCVHGSRDSSALVSARKEAKISQRAEKFFSVLDAMSREARAARVAWRTHFDLLSDIDEMNQCKRSMRLAAKDEDFSKLTPEEQGSVVLAADVAARYMEHGAKQAMTLGELRRNKDTLRYLRNQSRERHQENQCTVCLSPLTGECAVLACGHRFHYSPCFEKLLARNGNQSMIRCPFRCDTRTKREDVLIATNKRRDDGSQIARQIKGSWGTKVTRLVADVMDVKDLGEKSIVFSQWEDMLEVAEHALAANEVKYVRAKRLTKLGDSVTAFRSSDCAVLLMNTKNGATGLTLVEATHVFMIEPLLNCGLDSQAINRIHRIGQTQKTYVHRYLIQDTIEEKIDAMRVERQSEQLEDALHESRKKHDVSAGGIDGGFSVDELQEILK